MLGKSLEWSTAVCWGGAAFLLLARHLVVDPSATEVLDPIFAIAVVLGLVTGIARRRMRSIPGPARRRDMSPAEYAREVLDSIEPAYSPQPLDRLDPLDPPDPLDPQDPPDLAPTTRPRPTDRPGGDTHDVALALPIPSYRRLDVDGWLPRRAVRERTRRFERSASG